VAGKRWLCLVVAFVLVLSSPASATALSSASRTSPPLPHLTAQANTYVVWSNAADPDYLPGNGDCLPMTGPCTLHAAIDEANADGVPSIIVFGTRLTDANFIWGETLPTIIASDTTIDASSQWDATYNRPGVDVRAGANQVSLVIASSHNVVRGLMLSGGGSGVQISGGSDNTIGGTDQHQGNVFVNGQVALLIKQGVDGNGDGNTVVGNSIGTVDGTSVAISGAIGIRLISGLNSVTGNVIAGEGDGLRIEGNGNLVYGNYVGIGRNLASVLPNADGVELSSGQGNAIGPNNYIAANTAYGVNVYHAQSNTIRDNWIGYGSHGNGSHGVNVLDGANTVVTGNVIAANGGDGIHAYSSVGLDIRGNTIGAGGFSPGNAGHGIYLDSLSTAQIGGGVSGDRNVIGGNHGDGVHLDGCQGVTVAGNWVGLDTAGGFDAGNGGYGIYVSGSGNTIGGISSALGNWIAYNDLDGIRLQGSGATGNMVLSNVLGVPINWQWPAGNGHHGIALYDGASGNYVGGLLGGGNTVLASGWSGLAIASAPGNFAFNNRIGTNGAGVHFGNGFHGVHIYASSGEGIAANEIAYNTASGIRVEGAAAYNDRLLANSVHDNGGGALAVGIVLVSGGNGGVAAPTITAASCSGASGAACPNCDVQVLSDGGDQGQVYHGYVTANGSGAWSYGGALAGPNVTAILTDGSGNSSAFSAPFAVGVCNTAPIAAFTIAPTAGTTATAFQVDATGCADVETPVEALTVRWDWEDDGTYDTDWSAGKVAGHTYASAGLTTIRLQVRDGGGLTADATQQVQVSAGPPTTSHFVPLVMR
jgi:hypothetical protein